MFLKNLTRENKVACISCEIIHQIQNSLQACEMKICQTLIPEIHTIFKYFLQVWFIWQIIFRGLIRANLLYKDFLIKIIIFVMVSFLLQNSELLNYWIFSPLDTFINMFLKMIARICYNYKVDNYCDILQFVDDFGKKIYDVANLMWNSVSLFSLSIIPAAICLLMPFSFLWALFLVFIVEYVFCLFLIKSLSPLLLLCFGFNSFRCYVYGAFNAFLQSIINLCLSFIVMCFSLNQSLNHFNKIPISQDQITTDINEWIFGRNFLVCCLITIIGIILNLRIRSISSTIVNSTFHVDRDDK